MTTTSPLAGPAAHPAGTRLSWWPWVF